MKPGQEKYKLIYTLLSITFIICFLLTKKSHANIFLPTGDGCTWTYDYWDSNEPTKKTVQHNSSNFVSEYSSEGITIMSRYFDSIGGDIFQTKSYYHLEYGGASLYFTPPILTIPGKITPGVYYDKDVTELRTYDNGNPPTEFSMHYKYEVVGFENITVPYGTFSALKTKETRLSIGSGTTYISYFWFVQNIGPIKIHATSSNPEQQFSYSSTQELKSFVPSTYPVANAAHDQTVFNSITLDASQSSDSDGSISSYQWSILLGGTSGTPYTTASGESPTILDLVQGFYSATLTVTDDGNFTDTDTMVFTATGPAVTLDQHNQALALKDAELANKDQTIDTFAQLISGKDITLDEQVDSISKLSRGDFDEDCDVDGSDLAVFTQNFGKDTCSAGSVVGSWGPGLNPYLGIEYASLTFYPNGYYLYWESRGDGDVEYGTYLHNEETNLMTFTAIIDDNPNEGPSYADGNTSVITVTGDTLSIDGEMIWHRVQNASSPIVGGWGEGHYESGGSEYINLTFYPNGYYIHYETDNPSETCDEGGGVEYGNYAYDPTNEELTATPILDENGCIGLSDNGIATVLNVKVIGNNLTFLDNGAAEDVLPRVK